MVWLLDFFGSVFIRGFRVDRWCRFLVVGLFFGFVFVVGDYFEMMEFMFYFDWEFLRIVFGFIFFRT